MRKRLTILLVIYQSFALAQTVDTTMINIDSLSEPKWRFGIQGSLYNVSPFSDEQYFYSSSGAYPNVKNDLEQLTKGKGKSVSYKFYMDIYERIYTSFGIGVFQNNYSIKGKLTSGQTLLPDYEYTSISQKITYNALYIPLDIQFYWIKRKISAFTSIGAQYNFANFSRKTLETQDLVNKRPITFESNYTMVKPVNQNVYISTGIDLNIITRYQLRVEPFYMVSLDKKAEINTSCFGVKTGILIR